jgi:imidazolonepropionase-like amidohydrolase
MTRRFDRFDLARVVATAAIGLAAATLAFVGFAPLARAGTTAITGATVVDAAHPAPIPDAIVLIDGERITAVGPRSEVKIPAGATIVDASGKWLVPGLIDAHVHFFQSGGLYTRPDAIDLRATRSYADELAWIKRRLPSTFVRYLASGVTSVVDVGGPMWNFEVRQLASANELAPRVAVAGPLVSTWQPPQLACPDPPIIECHTPDEARTLVKKELEHEPDLVKIWFIHRAGEDLAKQSELVRAAIDESHAAAVRVAVHATQLEVARAAVEAGCDVLVHSVDDKKVDDAFVQLLLDHDVLYTTTLVVHEGYDEVLGQSVDLNDVEKSWGDPEVIATWADLAKLPEGKDRPARPRSPTNPNMLWNLKRLQDAGVVIAAGTDAGNIGTLHGPSLHREFELMRDGGLTPLEILRAATVGSAKVMGRDKDLGTIEPGKLADLLVLTADPTKDVVNLRRIERVIRGGRVHTQADLLARANAPPASH